MQKLVILDPKAHYTHFLRKYFGDCCEIIVYKKYGTAAEFLARTNPEYLILDLTSAEFEGFTLLRSAVSLGANPSVIGIIQSSYFFSALVEREKNISSTVSRPFHQDVIANRLSLMMELPPDRLIPLPTRRQFVSFLLSSLDIDTQRLGGKHLLDLIPMVADNPNLFYTKHLYLAAGKLSGHSGQNVERNIRTAIEHGWSQGGQKKWARFFPADENGFVAKPKNSEFISLLANILNVKRGQYREDD